MKNIETGIAESNRRQEAVERHDNPYPKWIQQRESENLFDKFDQIEKNKYHKYKMDHKKACITERRSCGEPWSTMY